MTPKNDYLATWRAANREHLKAYRHERYLAHRAEEIANAERWTGSNYERHLIQLKVSAANRRYPDHITIRDVDAVIAAANRTCRWCGKRNLKGKDLTLEHVEPFNRRECLGIACHACNAARIPRLGPRKTDEEKRAIKNELARKWRATHLEQCRKSVRESQRRRRARLKRHGHK